MGLIANGAVADLVLLEINPLDDVANTQKRATVVAQGRLLERQDLDSMFPKAERVAGLKSIAREKAPARAA